MLNKDLVAASSKPLVLSILEKGESYGYEIIQKVRQLSDNQIQWSDGMLYPVLHKLEKDGLLISRWQAPINGRRRKYYSITEAGKLSLEQEKSQWQVVNQTFSKLWEVAYAYS